MRILWIKTSPLHPLTRGGDLRTYHLLRWLHRWHDVTFSALVADPLQIASAKKANEYSCVSDWVREAKATQTPNRLGFLWGALSNIQSILPYAVERFVSSQWTLRIAALLAEGAFDVVVCDFIFPAASLPWTHKRPDVPWVVFQHNVESIIWKRRAAEARGIMEPYLKSQWHRMHRYEAEMCRRFDAVLTVSDEDARVSRDVYGLENVRGAIPTGVDLEYFSSPPREFPRQPTLVFVGSMDWYANVDAVRYFVAEIWPSVRAEVPEALLQVVGRNPPPEICALGTPDSGIEVTGTVSDVRPFLRKAHAMIVPLRIGGGTRLKVFEAMAAGIPVVSTRVGVEGLEVTDERHVLLADSAADFGTATLRLLKDRKLAERLAATALNEIAEQHSWEKAARIMETHLLKLIPER